MPFAYDRFGILGESMKTRKDVDPIFSPDGIGMLGNAFLAGKNPRTPLASPLYGDPKGFPPLLIQVGDHEVLLDDSNRLAQRARAAGVRSNSKSGRK